MSSARQMLAKLATDVRPSLFRYMADHRIRGKFSVSVDGSLIDIIRRHDDRFIRISRSNAVYLVNIIEQFDDFFNAVASVMIRRAGKQSLMVDFSSPRLQQVIGFDDFPVLCPSLTEGAGANQQWIDVACLAEGETAIDLGAYNGMISILFSKAVGPTGRVVALEPDPLNFYAADYNFATHRRVNALGNISLVAAAASADDGVLSLSSEGATGSALTSIVGKRRGATVPVEALSLQTLADRHGLDKIDFMKVDIEGAELNLIPKSVDFLRRYRPRLLVEPHLIQGRCTTGVVTKTLSDLGYVLTTIDHRGVPVPFIAASLPS